MLEAGKKLQERYQIERHVGQGGMGSVYLATDERFHSTVAIKEALFADEHYRKAFAREARLLNSLKHSALPKVTDHFVEDKSHYIVMEYIGGDDLFEMMRKSGHAFPVDEVLEWADQLLDALAYLHDQGIIHRDIKPQNLKLTPQRKIILLDFGLAKGNPTDANYQTAAQSIFGYSRNYASLEQIQGTGTDPRSDVYSLAATLYHLLTDRVPADALTRVMMVLNENRDPLESAGVFNPALSQEISDALDNCLSLKAASRPQNVNEMKQALFPGTTTDFSVVAGAIASQENYELLTMNTKLVEKGADTGGEIRQSEMRTEVLNAQGLSDSVRTRVLNKGTEHYEGGQKTSRGRFGGSLGLASAAGLIALIVGGVASMVYFWPPETTTLPVGVTEQTVDSNGTNEIGDVENADLPVEALEEKVTDEFPAGKTDERADTVELKKTSRPKKVTKVAAAPTRAPKTGKGKSAKDTELWVEGLTIKEGEIETDSAIMTDEGFIFKKTPVRRPPPVTRDIPMTRKQFEKLTPKQKKRVMEALRKERRLRNIKIPPQSPDVKPSPH